MGVRVQGVRRKEIQKEGKSLQREWNGWVKKRNPDKNFEKLSFHYKK